MSTTAKVGDLNALRQLRAAIIKFAELADVAMGDADSDVQRTVNWVEHDQATYWVNQHRKRQEALVKAKEALRHKQIFKDPSGGRQGTAEEEKAVQIAIRRMAEAEQKMAAVKKWGRQLEKEFQIYKGSVQRLGTAVMSDVPNAIARLDRMLIALEGYVNLGTPSEVTSTAEQPTGPSMARGEAGPPKPGDVYRRLRARSPEPKVRDSISQGDPTRADWTFQIPPDHQAKLEAIPMERSAVDPSATVIYAADVWQASRIYLHRIDPAFPGDSGWTIAPAIGDPPQAFEAAHAGEVLKACPLLANLLMLPAGALVMLDAAGIAAVLDQEDHDLWNVRDEPNASQEGT